MNFAPFTVLTFDCYGTLIDWESGILAALRGVLDRRGIRPGDDELLALFAETESPIQYGEFRRYRDVLDLTMEAVARRLGFEPSPEERAAISNSLASWRPFPDTVDALRRLASHFRLGLISNVDDDLFAGTAPKLGVTFDWVVTAEQVRSYKPSVRNFEVALQRIGRPKGEILHCAQSLFHDIGPARSVGLTTVWVDRRAGKPGAGATPKAAAEPHLTVPDLRTLADLAVGTA